MDPSTHRQAIVAAIAALQAGHITTWQCLMAGMSTSWARDQGPLRGWVRVHRGVHRLGGVADSPLGRIWAAVLAVSDATGPARAETLRREGGLDLVAAVVEAARTSAVVTGLTAAWLNGCAVSPPHVPQLLVPTDVQTRGREIRLVRSTVPRSEVQRVRDLWCAPLVRVLWDVAWILRHRSRTPELVGDLAVELDRRRLLAVDELVGAVDEPVAFELPSRVPRALRAAAEIIRPGFSHSRTEAIAREIALEIGSELGLEVSSRPYPISADGVIIAEADIAVPELRWDIEIDGPHHRAPSMRRRDRRRDAKLAEIVWSVSRHDHELIDHDLAAFGRQLRSGFEQALDRAA